MRSSLGGHSLRSTILRECIGRRRLRIGWCLRLLGRVPVELTCWRTILTPLNQIQQLIHLGGLWTYAAFQWTAVHVVATQLADCHSCIFMGIHLDKRETPIRLKARLCDKAEILEQWNEIVLGCIGREVTNITCGLPLGSLCDHHLVTLHSLCRKVVMTVGCRGRHSHGGHGLLLGDRGLAFLVCPIASDRTRT